MYTRGMGPKGWKGGDAAASQACPAELVDGMGEFFAHLREHLERVAQRVDVPLPCLKALRIIEGPVSMKELGARMHCDASFVTAVADMLEERGLARREVDPADRRVKRLSLTDRGASLRKRLVDEMLADVPGLRTLDERERATMMRLVRTMLRREAAAADAEKAGSAA
jgi:MarR family transcriptional regulator, organic hydroperoxide resistance regulator